jgi:glyceraldehyde 3-phosphate dehydrogenase
MTCPHPHVDATLVMGANHHIYSPEQHQVISASSCTGNAAAPVVDLIDMAYNIVYADIETIHPNQNFESAVDGVGQAAGMARGSIGNVKNVESGVVSSVLSVLPRLKGRLNPSPLSYRTPTASGCFLRYDFITARAVTDGAGEINSLLQQAAQGSLQGILDYQEPLMGVTPPNSLDVKGSTAAVLISPQATTVCRLPEGGSIVRLLGLHDTELGYSACVARTIREMERKGWG